MDESARAIASESYLAKDQFARYLRAEVLAAGPGSIRVKIDTGKEHLNGHGGVHGGVIFALADIAFAMACNASERQSVGIQASISYINGATEGPLYAEAREVSTKSRLAHYLVDVTTGQGTLVAQFTGTSYRLSGASRRD